MNDQIHSSSASFLFFKNIYTFYSSTVTVGEAGKCSASVRHRSDSASVCSAQRQPELLLFHLDHSSLPRRRMLRLTGPSFSSSVSCSLALSLSPPRLTLALSYRRLGLLLCSDSLCFFLHAPLFWLCLAVLSPSR